MLSANLTVVDSHSSLTLPGSIGSVVYNQVAWNITNQILRRVAATANTTPQELLIAHAVTGKGFAARIRSLVKGTYRDLTKDLAETGGIVPSVSVGVTIDRPVQSDGAITDTIIKNVVGAVLDVILTSGALAQLLNQES
jgi:hypothetical protein